MIRGAIVESSVQRSFCIDTISCYKTTSVKSSRQCGVNGRDAVSCDHKVSPSNESFDRVTTCRVTTCPTKNMFSHEYGIRTFEMEQHA
eukprot:2586482-Pyramimonas_sp.AAC.2